MSWFRRDSPLRNSFTRKPPKIDAAIYYDTFKVHWSQVWSIIQTNELEYGVLTADDVNAVVNHLDHMITLLVQETSGNSEVNSRDSLVISPILDYVLTEGILDKLYGWSVQSGEFFNVMKLEQLKIYEVLVSHSHHSLLFQKPVVRPMLQLLRSCRECNPVEVEKRLIILLNTLCVCLSQHPELLEIFFHATSEQGFSRFLIFSMLIPFVHREGAIGQQARDALLLCMALSRKNESIGIYIADHSTFCPVLATGLSGLYSVLPRKLHIVAEDWHRFTAEDIQDTPELEMFLNSLEFCNAVLQVAHPMVQDQLLEYIYQGFLIPVLGPALHQSSVEEIVAATAYMELSLRTITEPILIHVFLRFIVIEDYEGTKVLDTLVKRIASQSRLCLVTMALFRTLLDFNCEDVMLELVFKYLNPCSHVMVSQRCRVRDVDIFGHTAEKFLNLVPVCCLPDAPSEPSTPSQGTPEKLSDLYHSLPADRISLGGSFRLSRHMRSSSTSSFAYGEYDSVFAQRISHSGLKLEHFQTCYQDYLREARQMVLSCTYASLSWSSPYDGLDASSISTSPTGLIVQNGLAKIPSDSDIQVSEDLPTNFEKSDRVLESNTETAITNCNDKVLVDDNQKEQETGKSGFDLSPDLCGLNSLDSGVASSCKTECRDAVSESGSFEMVMAPDSDLKDSGLDPCEEVFESLDDSKGEKAVPNSRSDSSWDGFDSPDIGPFLNILLTRLELMMQNDVYVNLQLTGLIARLALYPQPLLRSFLLNHSLVFQPSVRSLLQVLSSLKHKLDSYSYTVDNFEELLLKARHFLAAREDRLLGDTPPRIYAEASNRRSADFIREEPRRRSFTNFLFNRGKRRSFAHDKGLLNEHIVETIPDSQGYRYTRKPTGEGKVESFKVKNAVLCAVVFEEFLKELAAITQEHSVLQADPEFFSWLCFDLIK